MIKKTHLLFCFSALLFVSKIHGSTQVYFNNECEDVLIEKINNAQKSIYCAIFTFTRFNIAKSLINAKERGLTVSIVIDAKQADSEYGRKIVHMLNERNVTLFTVPKKDRTHMHHKFCIVDGEFTLNGSYNYTTAASKHNDENLLVIKDKTVAAKFFKEWQRLKLLVQKKAQPANGLRKSSTKK